METALRVEDPPSTREPKVVALIRLAASQMGLGLQCPDAEFGHLFWLTDGRRRVTLLGGKSPLNDAVAARICEDKYYTGVLLQHGGIRVPESVRCLKPGHFQQEDYAPRCGKDPAAEFARQHGYPLVVKPNRLSHGRDVQLVYDQVEMSKAIDAAWQRDYIALVQTAIPGEDLRLDFLDGQFLVGYVRKAAHDSTGEPASGDITILNLAQGAKAELLREVPEQWSSFGQRVGEMLNLRFFGIDVKAPGLESNPDRACVIEVNASPLFVQLFHLGFETEAVAAQRRVMEAVWGLA
jgi:glutathione synthase/RimK-type ligase-like ATP-grasp enzyme